MKVPAMSAVRVVGAVLLLGGCMTVSEPRLPPQAPPGSRQDAQRMYEDLRINKVGTVFTGSYYLQGAGTDRYRLENMSSLFESLGPDTEMSYRKGRNQTTLGTVLASVGGACIGYPLGSFAATGELRDTDNYLLGSGAALVVVSAIIASSADKSLETAVDQFNADLQARLGLK